jgi:DNA invertase Pin-like site-specific DNA recombinase
MRTNHHPRGLRAAIYARISEDTEGDYAGVGRQLEDCRALCERNGWPIYDEYVDDDRSAFRQPEKLVEHARMSGDAKNNLFDVIVAWHPDRLNRGGRFLEDFIAIIENSDIGVATCTAGELDLSTPEGRYMARVIGAHSRMESEDKSRRTLRKQLALAQEGAVVGGGHRPFGYERVKSDTGKLTGLKVVPAEAKLIKEAAKRVLAGENLYAIVNDWTARGVTTVTGAAWNTKTLKQILVSGRVAGWRTHQGQPMQPDPTKHVQRWKPILDEATWKSVRAILTDPSRKRRGRAPRSYLLGPEQIRCGRCGHGLSAHPQRRANGEPVPAYACLTDKGGCGRLFIKAPGVEELVRDWTLAALDSDDYRKRLTASTAGADEDAEERLAELEAQLAQASRDFYVLKEITRPEFLAARDALLPMIEEARAAQAGALRRQPRAMLDGLDTVRQDWDSGKLTLSRKRALIGLVLRYVTIAPAQTGTNTFDPDRVIPAWTLDGH